MLIIFQQTIRNYVSDTIGDILVKSMEEATGGVYKTTYDLVRFDIISSELRISNLKIELDTTVISKEDYLKSKPNLIHVNTPIIVVKLKSIFPLVFSNKLYVSYVGAQNPDFELIKSKHGSVPENASAESQQDIRETINNYFSALEIDSFRLKNGAFNISNHQENDHELDVIKVKDFSMLLKNFRLDSLSPSILLKGIRAQSLDLQVIDQDVNLPKLNQSIHFEKFSLSTTDSTITLDSLTIKNLDKTKGRANSTLRVKQVELHGVNFDEAFKNNNITINELHVVAPKIHYDQLDFTPLKKVEKENKGTLFEAFNQFFIKDIRVFNGEVDYHGRHNTRINNFSVGIADYTITPEDWKNRQPVSDFQLLFLNANNLTQELPDSIHTATVEQVTYSPIAKKLALTNLKVSPIKGRNTYKYLKARNSNLYTRSSISSLTLTGFNVPEMITKGKVEIDSVIINRPKSFIVQYPGMYLKPVKSKHKNKLLFNVNYLIANNGSLRVKSYQNKSSQEFSFTNIYATTGTISQKSSLSNLPKQFNLVVGNARLQLKNTGHTTRFTNLRFSQHNHLYISEVSLQPDSSNLPYHHIKGKLSDVAVQGIQLPTLLSKQKLEIDSLTIGLANLTGDFTRRAFEQSNNTNNNGLKDVIIGKLQVNQANAKLAHRAGHVAISGTRLSLDSLKLDSLQASKASLTYKNTALWFDNLLVNNLKNNSTLQGQAGSYLEADSSLVIRNLTYTQPKNKLKAGLESINILGLDKEKLTHTQALNVRKIQFNKPYLIISTPPKDSTKAPINANKQLLTKGLKAVSFDTLEVVNGHASIALPNQQNINLGHFKGILTSYRIDTTTSIFEAVNKAKGVFEFTDINLRGLKDTLSVTKLHIDAYQRFLWTDSIYFDTQLGRNKLRVVSPGIGVDYIDIPALLHKKVEISRISTRNNFIELTQTDTIKTVQNKSTKGFTLPLNLNLNKVNILSSRLKYTKINQPNHALSSLHFDIAIDSLEGREGHPFDLAHNTKDTRLTLLNFATNLPDSLNTLGFDTLKVSSKKAEIELANLTLQARYPKYEYGNQVGYQVDWKDLLIEKIKVSQIDFEDLLEKGTLKCEKITLANGHLKLFKDKQLPFPTDRRIPILQDRIRNLKMPVKIDTIQVKGLDIYQTTLQSTGKTEGSISFNKTNGLITNITNDSLRLQNNRLLNVVADTRIMNSGDLYAEFEFDMLDPNRLFFFDARLGPMNANAFNNILEATAFVKVKSGQIKSINLHATGNKSYAYGDMSFIYSNLKVETINKKTLENKGMGKVLKTFFANAFVVKKNNSRLKLLARRGGMYYERDPSRITLDYMAKTALSGVVSSIGAKSNRKQIKQIQKDNKAARDLELKQQKEATKAAKKKARKE